MKIDDAKGLENFIKTMAARTALMERLTSVTVDMLILHTVAIKTAKSFDMTEDEVRGLFERVTEQQTEMFNDLLVAEGAMGDMLRKYIDELCEEFNFDDSIVNVLGIFGVDDD